MVVRVDQADAGEEEGRTRREMQIDLVGEALHPLPGVEAQDGLAVQPLDAGADGQLAVAQVERRAGAQDVGPLQQVPHHGPSIANRCSDGQTVPA